MCEELRKLLGFSSRACPSEESANDASMNNERADCDKGPDALTTIR
jgi:hypothetical protein